MQSTTIRLGTRDGIKSFTFTPALTSQQQDELNRVIRQAISPNDLRRAVENWAAAQRLTLQVQD